MKNKPITKTKEKKKIPQDMLKKAYSKNKNKKLATKQPKASNSSTKNMTQKRQQNEEAQEMYYDQMLREENQMSVENQIESTQEDQQ